ncbi:MAG: phosphoribosylanthranilate isomerase [Alphaproteobacteria bacterium]|nr:phosphoribosylanthranilate isomerase [Alphaproteobacteria bacterium]
MTIAVKICGITTAGALDAALEGGATHIGLVFFPPSPRYIAPDDAVALAARIAGRAKIVGLFVNPADAVLRQVLAKVPLDIIQLHGEEAPARASDIKSQTGLPIWKAVPVRKRIDLAVAEQYLSIAERILYDAKAPPGAALPGGNGMRFDWEVLRGHRHSMPWILSGGLDAGNIAEAVRVTGAIMLDVSSGVETAPGVKDVDKIKAFLHTAAHI